MGDDDKVLACASFIVMCGEYLNLKKTTKGPKKRRWWMSSLNKSRNRYNATNLIEDLRREPSGKFENFCRMSATDFEFLLCKIGPMIRKSNTNMREAIPVQERLAVSLRFLASGDSFSSLSYLFKFSIQTVSRCVYDVCSALIQILKEEIKIPKNPHEWKLIEKEFSEVWNFPHCCGSMDGKHIVIQSPIHSGSEYINYKGTFSVVLFALVDANYNFLYANIGCQGIISDGGVFKNTSLYKSIEEDQLMLPPALPLPLREFHVPYVFLADDAFALSSHLMKPYSGIHEKGSKERVFNYRLSRARRDRRVVENVFGIMASVFRVMRKPMLLEPEKVTNITLTCALLHNFLRKSKTSSTKYSPNGTFDLENEEGQIIPGAWRQEESTMTSLLPLRNIPRKPGMEAKQIREEFATYFATNGKVPWQNAYC
ncbi:uncharacterized protein LOC115033105 [Acyrthosiphon pisum]|uniref:DDE Tnp4 domain-containing protein n=1 Tax=Acyrthosiphon pisum TaxID=7029 RepID=A0A8R2JKW8_ACYPI|nr:uncharacterized protein LOC115033105 [Acyrthosiphon pisum]